MAFVFACGHSCFVWFIFTLQLLVYITKCPHLIFLVNEDHIHTVWTSALLQTQSKIHLKQSLPESCPNTTHSGNHDLCVVVCTRSLSFVGQRIVSSLTFFNSLFVCFSKLVGEFKQSNRTKTKKVFKHNNPHNVAVCLCYQSKIFLYHFQYSRLFLYFPLALSVILDFTFFVPDLSNATFCVSSRTMQTTTRLRLSSEWAVIPLGESTVCTWELTKKECKVGRKELWQARLLFSSLWLRIKRSLKFQLQRFKTESEDHYTCLTLTRALGVVLKASFSWTDLERCYVFSHQIRTH